MNGAITWHRIFLMMDDFLEYILAPYVDSALNCMVDGIPNSIWDGKTHDLRLTKALVENTPGVNHWNEMKAFPCSSLQISVSDLFTNSKPIALDDSLRALPHSWGSIIRFI